METDYMNQISAPRFAPPKPKIPVKIILSCNEKGVMIPLCIMWSTGIMYKIDEVIDIKPRGVNSIFYKVKICGKLKELYFNNNKWYVNQKG